MINRDLEQQIKKTKSIIQLWTKFRELYRIPLSRTDILPEEENGFLELKSSLTRQYQGLLESLDIGHSPDDRTFEVIGSILSLSSVPNLNEMQLKKVENDWHNSYLSLNKILGSLENKREQLGKINTVKITIKKIFSSYIVSLIFIVLFIVLAYIILVQVFHTDEIIKGKLNFLKTAETVSEMAN